MTDYTEIVKKAKVVLAEVDPVHCPICGWIYADIRESGCVPGNCSYRPHHGSPELERIRANRKAYVTVELAAALVEIAEENSQSAPYPKKGRQVRVDTTGTADAPRSNYEICQFPSLSRRHMAERRHRVPGVAGEILMSETKAGLPTDYQLREIAHAISSVADPWLRPIAAEKLLREVRDRTERATKAKTLRWAARKIAADHIVGSPLDIAVALREAAEEAERE